MTERRSRERPLGLDMDPDEALERFLGVDPAELPESSKLKPRRRPPKRPPGVADKDDAAPKD